MSLSQSRIKTLILALQYQHTASYYDDWADAFGAHPAFEPDICNILNAKPSAIAGRIEDYDAVILLHSCTGDTTDYLAPLASVLAERRRAKLLAFVGNEYNSAIAPLSEKIAVLESCRADIVATQLLQEAGDYLYAETGASVISVPHALNPAVFELNPPHNRRKLDIGFRGYRYPLTLGDNDRNQIVEFFVENGPSLGLSIDVSLDISQETRFERKAWAGFLADCRGTISTEAGSWFLDRDDALAQSVHDYLARYRKGVAISHKGPLRRLARRLPMPVRNVIARALRSKFFVYDGYEAHDVDFEKINEVFFQVSEKASVYSKAISSRHFDAIGTRTCQIMFPGRFNDILVPHEHYIPLDPNFRDIGDVVDIFQDASERRAIVDRAFDHVMSAHTYAHRLTDVARILGA